VRTNERPAIQIRGMLKPALERLTRPPTLVVPPATPSACADWRVQRLELFVNRVHGRLGWNLDVLCRQLGLGISGSHGARLFKKQTGLGFREYSKRRRLAVAADQLEKTSLSVKEIAADLGYKSQTDLSRQFRNIFGLNPTDFRMAHHRAIQFRVSCGGGRERAGFKSGT